MVMETTETRPKRVCSPKYAVQKARRGKKLNRWEIEELATDAEQSVIYAQKVLKGRFPEGEPAIAQNIPLALDYARDIMNGRFELAEPNMISNLDWSSNRTPIMNYFVKNGVANKEIERRILERESMHIPEYAAKCMGGRWPEAEPVLLRNMALLQNISNVHKYHRDVIKDRWPELEDRIILMKKGGWTDERKNALKDYFRVVSGPNLEFVEKMGRSNKAGLLMIYAVNVVKGRLPPHLHQKMMMFSFDPKRQKAAKSYVKFLDRQGRRALEYLLTLDDQERAEIMDKARTN